MPTVSWSEVKLFRRCMKAHDYRYRQRIKRKKKAIPLLRGSMLHDMLNAYVKGRMIPNYQGPDAGEILDEYEEKYQALFIEEREEHGDIVGDCEKIFQNYIRMYKTDTLEYEESEAFVATDLADEIRLIGYIDKVAVDQQGRRWLFDHKFVKTIPNDNYQELQLLIYYWTWSRWKPDKPVDGIVWDFGRTKVPAEPELLKSGALSKRKNIDSTPHAYMAAIGRHGLNADDYEDILRELDGKEAKFFHRDRLPKPPKDMVSSVVDDFRASAVMIQKLKGVAPRNMSTFNCKTCEYRNLCEAEVRGHDSDFILKSEYEPREEYEGDEHAHAEEEN